MAHPIKILLFTGLLGVGKTSVIRSLFARKPVGERWAVIVNEFGDVSIDTVTLTQTLTQAGQAEKGFAIREVVGGCLCCTSAEAMHEAVDEIVHSIKPDRLLIEPSGLGHPARVIEMLTAKDLRGLVEIQSIIALVDPRELEKRNRYSTGLFRDMIALADGVFAAKTDLASDQERQAFLRWGETLFPPKGLIGEVMHGEIGDEIFTIQPCVMRNIPISLLNAHAQTEASDQVRQGWQRKKSLVKRLFHRIRSSEYSSESQSIEQQDVSSPLPGRWIRKESRGLGHLGCGWIFHRDLLFDQDALLGMLKQTKTIGKSTIRRLKGVFRIDGTSDALLIDRVENDFFVEEAFPHRHESRLEVIVEEKEAVDWQGFERVLVSRLRDR
ncbi:MAG: GTP-binding protein [Magnetococcales bacterium]|nr:GTP-binding protein [Magnetococcales bacterium]